MIEYQGEQFPIPTPGRLRRELRLRRPPWWMVLGLIIVVVATWIPLYLVFQMRSSFSLWPKIHFIHDMDNQPGFRPQGSSTLFADGRASRQSVDGTLPRGQLREDDHFYRGYHLKSQGGSGFIEFFTGLPEGMEADAFLLARGADRYQIFCAVCHDQQGTGNGLVHQRAVASKEAKWVPPTNLMTQEIRDRADGNLFQAISDGVRNMPGYKTQVSVEDRWAIVAHVRQLQGSQPVAKAKESDPSR